MTELTDVAVTKYKAAAEIAKGALSEVIKACVPGAKLIDLNKIGDDYMTEAASKLYTKGKTKLEEKDKGIAFPTCVAVKEALCHVHPLPSDPEAATSLSSGDLVRIALSAHIDGFIAQTGHTLVVGATKDSPVTGRKADVMTAAHTACEVAIRMIKDGNKTTDLYSAVNTVLKSFECVYVEGMVCGQIAQNKLETGKQICFAPVEGQKNKEETFAVGEAYSIEMLLSTGEGKPKKTGGRGNVFRRDDSVVYKLKMSNSRAVFSEIATKFGVMAFGLERLDEPVKSKMGMKECIEHDLVFGFEPLYEKPGCDVAHLVFTVLLMPQGPLKLTSYPWDETLVSSDKKVQDSAIVDLLKTSVRPKKAKK